MRLCRLLALLVGVFTAAFTAYEYSIDEPGYLIIAGLGAAAVVILLGAALPIRRRINRTILGGGIVLYLLGVSATIGISYGTQQSMMLRGGMVGCMMIGLLLAMFWTWLYRSRPRRGFGNYYDR